MEMGQRCFPEPVISNDEGTKRIAYVPTGREIVGQCIDENGKEVDGLTSRGSSTRCVTTLGSMCRLCRLSRVRWIVLVALNRAPRCPSLYPTSRCRNSCARRTRVRRLFETPRFRWCSGRTYGIRIHIDGGCRSGRRYDRRAPTRLRWKTFSWKETPYVHSH